MLARGEGADAGLDVHRGRQADIHQVDFSIGEQLVQRFVAPHSRQVLHPAAVAKIALNIAPIPGALFGVARDQGRDLASFNLGHRLVVGHAHKADSNNADVDHYFLLVWNARIGVVSDCCQVNKPNPLSRSFGDHPPGCYTMSDRITHA